MKHTHYVQLSPCTEAELDSALSTPDIRGEGLDYQKDGAGGGGREGNKCVVC